MSGKALIKEIFTSIQGEGPYIGYKQLFVRFCGCNLNCSYCDTNFDKSGSKEYAEEELIKIINSADDCHSVSLTGGEPLLHKDYLKSVLPEINQPVYLETNSTLSENLKELINNIDIIAADIKLPSSSGCSDEIWEIHDLFFKIASKKELFAKLVFDKKISDTEIKNACELGKKYNIELILQPKTGNKPIENTFIEATLDKFLKRYKKVRVIPQVHKFLDIR